MVADVAIWCSFVDEAKKMVTLLKKKSHESTSVQSDFVPEKERGVNIPCSFLHWFEFCNLQGKLNSTLVLPDIVWNKNISK